ncbi:monovalent cation/proton antiporter, MnhG/PhaG subunit [Oscillochloris trichoides DG-6]|uniref:Monovalent cation/proton antiporter, MnhG/PhaG subunit n=1 Tax=Oscillochloris trichoides DG-6 TaxID=765420 RepID=E1IAP6_9CHLR|nr:monovalent cation/proton antiporter, MnhG/PhaG subunit [Oscillochloris trichoides DG-6]
MIEIITIGLTATGVFFTLIAAIGLLRLPDLYTRGHAVGKAGTLGVIGILLGVAFTIGDFVTGLKLLALIVFFFLTAPVATHMLERAAFLRGVQPIAKTQPNDLAGRYDEATRRLG